MNKVDILYILGGIVFTILFTSWCMMDFTWLYEPSSNIASDETYTNGCKRLLIPFGGVCVGLGILAIKDDD